MAKLSFRELAENIEMDVFSISNLNDKKPFSDSLLEYNEDWHPLKGFKDFNLYLGNPVSSHTSAHYSPGSTPFFTSLKVDQYSAIRKEITDIPYYYLSRTFNDLSFAPLGSQGEFEVGAKFSRNFKEGINFSLDYWRLIHEDVYQDQGAQATTFGIGLWINPSEKKYQSFLSFYANNFNESFNGGIADKTFLNTNLNAFRSEVPVVLSNATGRSQDYQIAYDSYLGNTANWNIHHQIHYKAGYFKFSDLTANTAKDSTFYESYLIDDRGVRVLNGYKILRNTLEFVRAGDHLLDLSLGTTHQLFKHDNELLTKSYNDLSINGKVGLHVKAFRIEGNARLGLLDIAGNLELNGKASANFEKLGSLSAGILLSRTQPYLMDRTFVVNHQVAWENTFDEIIETSIYGQLYVAPSKTSISLTSFIIDNAVFYNQLAVPEQDSEINSGLKLTVHQRLKWKWINSDHYVNYQLFDRNQYNLPDLSSKHKFFVEFSLFNKNLLTKIGGTYSQFINNDGTLQFMPAAGIFYQVDDPSVKYFHNVDLFIAAKIDNFRFFVSLDNVMNLYDGRVDYLTSFNPVWDSRTRFGVRWLLLD